MIWLTTIFLLIIAVHLWRQAAAEKRLYLDNVEDPEAAADEGLFSRAVGYFSVDAGDGTAAIAGDQSSFGRVVNRVQEKAERLGERVERTASGALSSDDESSFFGRAVRKVSEKSETMGRKLDAKLESAHADASGDGGMHTEGSLLGRVAQRVADAEEAFDNKMKAKAERMHSPSTDSVASEDNFLGKMVNRLTRDDESILDKAVKRVANTVDKVEQKVDDKLARARDARSQDDSLTRVASKIGGQDNDDDFIGRAASKLGPRMDAFDEKMIETQRKGE